MKFDKKILAAAMALCLSALSGCGNTAEVKDIVVITHNMYLADKLCDRIVDLSELC